MVSQGERQEFLDALNRFSDKADRLLAVPPSNRNTTKLEINAGGMGVWAATTACLIMVAMNIGLITVIIDQGRRLDRLQDHQAALYMMAPEVRTLVTKYIEDSSPKE